MLHVRAGEAGPLLGLLGEDPAGDALELTVEGEGGRALPHRRREEHARADRLAFEAARRMVEDTGTQGVRDGLEGPHGSALVQRTGSGSARSALTRFPS